MSLPSGCICTIDSWVCIQYCTSTTLMHWGSLNSLLSPSLGSLALSRSHPSFCLYSYSNAHAATPSLPS